MRAQISSAMPAATSTAPMEGDNDQEPVAILLQTKVRDDIVALFGGDETGFVDFFNVGGFHVNAAVLNRLVPLINTPILTPPGNRHGWRGHSGDSPLLAIRGRGRDRAGRVRLTFQADGLASKPFKAIPKRIVSRMGFKKFVMVQ